MCQVMTSAVFKDLGEAPNAQNAWLSIRKFISVQLMGEDVFPIPHIQDGIHYKLGGVVLKEELSKVEKLLQKSHGAIHVGMLKHFLAPSAHKNENEANLATLNNVSDAQDQSLNQKYIFYEENMRKGVKKSISVEIDGIKKSSFNQLPRENSMIVNFHTQGYEYLKKFYLLSTVYRASNVKVVVKINDRADDFCVPGPWTVGFKLHKYKFGEDGAIGGPKAILPCDWNVNFLKKSRFRGPSDKLPPTPHNEATAGPSNETEDSDGYVSLPVARREERSR